MITYKTYSRSGGVTVRGMTQTMERARKEAEAFIASQLHEDDLMAITESALPSTWSHCLVSVTVWYRKRR
jgi:hypothetical protein